jgi:hypothetical protein
MIIISFIFNMILMKLIAYKCIFFLIFLKIYIFTMGRKEAREKARARTVLLAHQEKQAAESALVNRDKPSIVHQYGITMADASSGNHAIPERLTTAELKKQKQKEEQQRVALNAIRREEAASSGQPKSATGQPKSATGKFAAVAAVASKAT